MNAQMAQKEASTAQHIQEYKENVKHTGINMAVKEGCNESTS